MGGGGRGWESTNFNRIFGSSGKLLDNGGDLRGLQGPGYRIILQLKGGRKDLLIGYRDRRRSDGQLPVRLIFCIAIHISHIAEICNILTVTCASGQQWWAISPPSHPPPSTAEHGQKGCKKKWTVGN